MNRWFISFFFASGLAIMTFMGCGETDVIASGVVRDSVTKLPIDSVRVVQFWLERKTERILNESYTDSTGRFLNWDFVGCGMQKCRFMVVFDKEGYWPQTRNNDNQIEEMVIDLVHQ